MTLDTDWSSDACRYTRSEHIRSSSLDVVKLSFHDADTDTDVDREDPRRHVRHARFPEVIPVASWTTRRHSRDDPREDVGEDVGVVECQLNDDAVIALIRVLYLFRSNFAEDRLLAVCCASGAQSAIYDWLVLTVGDAWLKVWWVKGKEESIAYVSSTVHKAGSSAKCRIRW